MHSSISHSRVMQLPRSRSEPGARAAALWTITLLVSGLPNIVAREWLGLDTAWLFWAKMVLLIAAAILTFVARDVARLRSYIAILLVIYTAEWTFGVLQTSPLWQSWFSGVSFASSMMSTQLIRMSVTLTVMTALWLIHRRRAEFFLIAGQADALAEPVRWVGMLRPARWSRFGWVLTVCISSGTLLFLLLAGRPTAEQLRAALPLFPFVLLFALMNAFSEELTYRASLLSTLKDVANKPQTLLLTAAYFGIGHYDGAPYGWLGVLMAGVLGWFLGKSMLETKGNSLGMVHSLRAGRAHLHVHGDWLGHGGYKITRALGGIGRAKRARTYVD